MKTQLTLKVNGETRDVIVPELPRTPTNKVQKHLLRERGVTETTWDRVAAGYRLQEEIRRAARKRTPSEGALGPPSGA